ncbi:MAG: hypothetical protein ABIK09_15970 [Pseudomonadota bacterium]
MRAPRRLVLVVLLLLLAACSTPASPAADDVQEDPSLDVQFDFTFELPRADLPGEDAGSSDVTDEAFDIPGTGPGCAPGDGCFLDPCEDHGTCLSGWCVGHMGEGVCTRQCESECPPGWSCQQIPGTAPDTVFICVSDHANLCLPCATGADCKGTAGEDAPCVDYGQEGSFCGGLCQVDGDCPWGFSCVDVQTVDGVPVQQCVADAGVCPCTGKSVSLGLFTPCEAVGDAGICTGKRICTDDGLSDCDALIPALEECNSLDDDCDGATDEGTCDDANPCTDDLCLGEEGCNHVPVEAGECLDGDPCTVADHCEEGVCVGDSVECDDGNPCTEDSCTTTGGCEFEAVFGPCDDGDPCTAGDLCVEGECGGTPVDCACQLDADCVALEDGDLCNGTLACDTTALPYQCVVEPASIVDCPAPVGPDAPCLVATCAQATGECSLLPANDGAPCSDGDSCTMAESCLDGQCAGGGAVNCNDGDPCTDDVCLPLQGCAHTDNDAPCFDGDVCTTSDTCSAGACQPGPPMSCDDNNPCTADSCDPVLGCSFPAQDGPCDDGNACTSGEVCTDGVCGSGAPVVCTDDNVCTTEICLPGLGCITTFNEEPCDDADLCTFGDHCHLGECLGAQSLPCDDQNVCTDDDCNPLTGCTFVPNDAACDDQDPCTVNDQCKVGWCLGEAAACHDGNPCTDDSCDPAAGCTFTPNAAPCDDGSLCTEGDGCSGGSCGGAPVACDDQEVCTTDGCDSQTGCTHAPVSDETSCGEGYWCQAGVCEDIPSQTITFDTLNYNGMTGWPLDYDAGPDCGGHTSQEQMDELCQLAGYSTATAWVSAPKSINNCYCWGACTNFIWYSNCCSGQQTQTMITQVTCEM